MTLFNKSSVINYFREKALLFAFLSAPIIWIAALVINPTILQFNETYPCEMKIRFGTVLQVLWLVGLPSILLYKKRESEESHQDSLSKIDQWVVCLCSIAFFSVLTGMPGALMALFIPAMILNSIQAYRQHKEKPLWHSRGLWVACFALIAYKGITLFWSPNFSTSWYTWRIDIWLLIVATVGLMTSLKQQVLNRFMRNAIYISLFYIFSIVLVYLSTCYLASCSPWVCFTLKKIYFPGPHQLISSHFIIQSYKHSHYTYAIFVMLLPIIYEGFSKRQCRWQDFFTSLPLYVIFAIMIYASISQSRIGMLLSAILLFILLLRFFFPKQYAKALLILSIGSIVAPILFLSPQQREYFFDGQRIQYLRIASETIDAQTLLKGRGMGEAKQIVESYPLPLEAKHFHNEYIQTLVETGLVGLILLLLVLSHYLWLAIKRKKTEAIIAIIMLSMLFFIDLFLHITEYIIGIWMLMCFMINYRQDAEGRKALVVSDKQSAI